MTKKKDISKEDLKKVLGGIKSNILNEVGSENQGLAALHIKYTRDRYIKDGAVDIVQDIGVKN